MSKINLNKSRLITLWGNRKEGDIYNFEDSKELSIGRDSDNNIVLEASTVSGRHCRVYEKDNHHYVEDLESTNGTMLNGIKIQSSLPLASGDIIKIGEIEILFESDEEKSSKMKTVLDLNDEKLMDIGSINNMSPFFQGRKDYKKSLIITYIVLGILGATCVWMLFHMMKSFLTI